MLKDHTKDLNLNTIIYELIAYFLVLQPPMKENSNSHSWDAANHVKHYGNSLGKVFYSNRCVLKHSSGTYRHLLCCHYCTTEHEYTSVICPRLYTCFEDMEDGP